MGNGYFRTSQTSTSSRQREKRGKDSYSYQHNYVDRVRLEDTNGQQQQQQQLHHQQLHHHSHHTKTTHDPRCPQLRAAGWRHTHKSVSHLDLATSCHGAAGAGIDHRHRQLQQQQLQQHHQQQRLHHQSDQLSHSHSHSHLHHLQPPLTPHAQPHWTQCRVGIAAAVAGQGQLRNARSLDYTQLEREENALDIAEFYWRFDAEPQLDAVNDNFEVAAEAEATSAAAAVAPATSPTPITATTPTPATTAAAATSTTTAAATGTAATTTVTFLDFGSESCSLRRSRSLAVIREETFSDLQIGSANSSRRRSQLIPRARLVNRGFFRESPRLLNKQQQNAAIDSQQQQQATQQEEEETPPDNDNDDDALSQISGATTCDSHQQQLLHLKQQQQQHAQHQQQQQQHPQHHLCPQRQHKQREAHDFDVYYDNLKRLDALALGLSEQLHPWHNDKSDLESLNSDYFKNSLHQSHAEQQQQQQQPSSLEFEALEQAVTLLSESRPRIYQSRRQQQQRHHHCLQRHIDLGAESCPEHSQSSVFPETTTSNSDDQTDSPSLSEQEYDLSHIEQIFQQGEAEEVEECYELISLTTTTRTRFESSEEEDHEERLRAEAEVQSTGESLTTPTETGASDSDGTLKRAHSEPLDKLIAYDSVYLSSEDSSECTLIGESCESFEQRTSLECGEVLTISIEDTVYEPQPKQHKKAEAEQQQQPQQIFTQILKIEQTPSTGITSSTASKPRIQSVVEKRKLLKQEQELKQQQQQQVPPPLPAPAVELKRQATDNSFVVVTTTTTTHKSNLTENQYHSLPDVNIGVSLKVCENIDKELRTSYNLKRQQQRRESKRQKEGGEQSQSEQNQVTRAETYDSIRRFGRAHQKARQREYEEREQRQRELEEALSTQGAEKETRQQPREQQVTKLSAAIAAEVTPEAVKQQVAEKEQEQHLEKEQQQQQLEEVEQQVEEEPLPPPPPPITEEEYQDSVSIAQAEQPKEAPVIEVANFSKLIERRAHEIRQRQLVQQEQEKQQQQQELAAAFRIIVTDAQNNIIQTEAIREEPKPVPQPISNPVQLTLRSLRRSSSSASGGKPAERRVLSAGAPIYKARPIKVLSNGDSFAARPKMSRPQILHVVDSSSNVGSLRRRSSARSLASNVSGEVATEYLQKVDAVKCYWNKLAGNEPEQQEATAEQQPDSRLHFQLGDKVSLPTTSPGEKPPPPALTSSDYCSIMPPSIEIVELGDGAQKATIVSAAQPQEATEDGDEDAAQFDHIRYKVLKSQQLIRSNILTARNKKEAQFDGLIQYLQDYSFQELLSNNNVVIVEPVRTKIERPLTVVGATGGVRGVAGTASRVAPAKPPRQAQVSTATKKPRQRQFGAGGGGGAAAKRHFFYQPVRVNRELYEDELPDPDTVRNVRRFFEQHVLPTPGQGILVQSQQKFGGSACQLSPKSRRARGYRYLTIDTSYGGSSSVAEEQPKGMEQLLEEHKVKQHWDNASLSSGISSGDLSSPCGECHMQQESQKESPMLACKGVHVLDVVRRHNSNAANAKARAKLGQRRTWCMGQQQKLEEEEQRQQVDNDDEEEDDEVDDDVDEEEDVDVETDMCESYYVSNDVLAKIRECGSTVTYYGGRVLEPGQRSNQPQQQQQQQQQQLINGNGIVAGGTATRSRVRQIEASCNVCCEPPPQQDSYQGIKFKLVKSNSCSSRLELAGACGGDGVGDALPDSNLDCELVRKMVHHFECNRPTSDGNQPPQPQPQLTINSQSTIAVPPAPAPMPLQELLERRQVTVNNHINVTQSEQQNGQLLEPTPTTYHSQAMNIRLELGRGTAVQQQQQQNGKVCRNKNVDLAYTLAKPSKEAGKSSSGTPQGNQKSTKQYNDIPLPLGLPLHVEQAPQKPQPVGAVKTSSTTAEVIGNREQIIVPVEIHQSQPQQTAQERRLSSASSSASIVDKTVVRHYVANDRSIYERRKYDDIEFEEFEVYDPAKELERQQQEEQLQQQQQQQPQQQQPQQQQQQQPQQLAQHAVNSIDRRLTDGELYDSLDDRM